MLPPWMIEELERERRERMERRPEARVELPVPPPGWVPKRPAWQEPEPEVPRGVEKIA